MGVVVKDKWNQLECGEGGLWFHYQLIKLQQASVAQFPLEAGKSILQGQFGKKCDNSNGHAPFAFKCENFCLSIQLKRRRVAWYSETMRMRGHLRGSFA